MEQQIDLFRFCVENGIQSEYQEQIERAKKRARRTRIRRALTELQSLHDGGDITSREDVVSVIMFLRAEAQDK